MIVDSHQHFWNLEKNEYPWLTPEYGAIHRSIEAPELEPLLRRNGVDRTVIVQAANSYEDTDYMLAAAEAYDWVAGVVGWVPLDRPAEAGRKLEQYLCNPYFKGVRHLNHDEADPNWLVRDEVIEGLKVLASFELPYDVVAIFPLHLKHVPTLAERVPTLRIVIDHLAKPPLRSGQLDTWEAEMARAADYPQVYAKVSGINTAAPADWSAADLQPAVDTAIRLFGADRLMFGSDWPVANLAGDYTKVYDETRKTLRGMSQADVDQIMGGTATRFYKL